MFIFENMETGNNNIEKQQRPYWIGITLFIVGALLLGVLIAWKVWVALLFMVVFLVGMKRFSYSVLFIIVATLAMLGLAALF